MGEAEQDIKIDLYWDGKTYFFEHVPTKKLDATLLRVVLSSQNYYKPTQAAKQHVIDSTNPRDTTNHGSVIQAVLKDGTIFS